MANKLTRIQIDTGTKDFTPKPYFTDEDIRKSKSPGVKPSITIRRQKLAPYKRGQDPYKKEVESEFGIRIDEDYKGFFFGKKFKKGGYSQGTCWDGYVQAGMKKKGNKMVPNCVRKMSKGGLKKWFAQKWVDIGSKKKGGGHKPCGRKSADGSKRKYPKCVPAAKAARMTDSQKRSAVARKRARAQGVGGKPTNVKTFAKK